MGTSPESWYESTVSSGPPPLYTACAAASEVCPDVVNATSVTVKSAGCTSALGPTGSVPPEVPAVAWDWLSFPACTSCALACCARKSWTAVVTVPTDACRGSLSSVGSNHGFSGYLEIIGYRGEATRTSAATGCQCGSTPRGPKLVFVVGPCEIQYPVIHRPEKIIIQPNNAT